jgi:peptide/nickel transport system substrate-binding protein
MVVATIAMLGGKEGAQTTVTQPTGTTTSPKLEITTPPDVLIIAMNTGDAVSLDPARAYEFTSVMVVNQIYDKLVDFEPPDMVNVKPEVAESWSVANDGVTWTFKIRKGIIFHSGRELTADDVVFSLQRVLILKQTAAWVLEQFVSNPDNIKKIDDYTVRIVLDKPVAPNVLFVSLNLYY